VPDEPRTPGRKFALFSAGLGDAIRVIYKTDAYRQLCEATEPTPVIVATHNPFTSEIFRFHRNAKNFVIYDLGHKYQELFDAGVRGAEVNSRVCEFAGLDYADMIRGAARPDFVPPFDAPDDVGSDGHLVLFPFAGSAGSRTWSPEFTARVVDVLRRQPRRVYLVARSFVRREAGGRLIHADEDARRFAGGNVTVLENLSVPATLNLVRRSAGYIGAWSSMQQAAWFDRRPVAVFYPKDYGCVVRRDDYAFGLDWPDCYHADYGAFDPRAFEAWLRDPTGPRAPRGGFWDWVLG
jgi:hypothetical protein